MTIGAVARGFTLIEMTVGLVLTGIVVLLAHTLLVQVVGGTEAIARARDAGQRAEDRLWFLDACRALIPDAPGGTGFQGTTRRVVFTTALPDAEGGVVPHPALMTIDGGTIALSAGGVRAVLVDSIETGTIDFLSSLEGSGGWVAGWDSPVSAPAAIRIRWIRAGVADTLVCPLRDPR